MVQAVRLGGARVALSATRTERLDLTFRRGRVLPFDARVTPATEYDLTGHLLLPGLINAHDHLEFNLFPRMGRHLYANATAWAADIYRPDEPPISQQLSIPKPIRLHWGGLKNLLSGVTTVAHHNEYEGHVFRRNFPIRVAERFGWAHSLAFSPDLAERYRRTPPRWPFIIHAAEGTDQNAQNEIIRLEEMGVLRERTVLVHAVGVEGRALDILRARRASIVWCPSSNLFTLGRTLSPEVLRSGLEIVLGTDSALTGEGDLIDEIRIARSAANLSAEELYRMVTTGPAHILWLGEGQGEIREHGLADVVAVKDHGQTPAEALEHLPPELVVVDGRIQLASTQLASRFALPSSRRFHSICIEGRGRWCVAENIPYLHSLAVKGLGPDFRLAGKRVSL